MANWQNPDGPPNEKDFCSRQPRAARAADAGIHADGHGGLVGVPVSKVYHERPLQGQYVELSR